MVFLSSLLFESTFLDIVEFSAYFSLTFEGERLILSIETFKSVGFGCTI